MPPSVDPRLNAGSGLGHLLENSLARLIDPVDGAITKENKQLDAKNQQFQSRIESLDKLLLSKRERLERQFAQMETVLADLQSQQQALGVAPDADRPSRRDRCDRRLLRPVCASRRTSCGTPLNFRLWPVPISSVTSLASSSNGRSESRMNPNPRPHRTTSACG